MSNSKCDNVSVWVSIWHLVNTTTGWINLWSKILAYCTNQLWNCLESLGFVWELVSRYNEYSPPSIYSKKVIRVPWIVQSSFVSEIESIRFISTT